MVWHGAELWHYRSGTGFSAMHAKLILFGSSSAIMGSTNLTNNAERANYEHAVILKESAVVAGWVAEFERVIGLASRVDASELEKKEKDKPSGEEVLIQDLGPEGVTPDGLEE